MRWGLDAGTCGHIIAALQYIAEHAAEVMGLNNSSEGKKGMQYMTKLP